MSLPAPDSPATSFAWHDGFLLGYAPLDAVHEEFVACVRAVQEATDAQLPPRMEALRRHAEDHFAQEDRWMEQTDFPARECHVNEHAAVLQSVREVQALLAEGNTAVCRRLADELSRWFPGHADFLDSALAQWMCQRQLGGKPVVVRRDRIAPAPISPSHDA